MVPRLGYVLLMLGAMLGLAACGGDPPAPSGELVGNAPLAPEAGKPMKTDKGETGLGVNAYLWRGALDTLSFMPLASADPFGGVITTDWWQPQSAAGERFKATAYILGRQLRADAIRVSIFRQVMENGQWVDVPVNQTTTAEIENKVLARARELRASGAKG
jgi:hypothetical protein